MRLYYTIISENGAPQTRPDLSLGGYTSSTLVPNADIGNLFSDLSCYSVRENRDEYIALTLVNETGAEVVDVTLYFDYPPNRQKDIEMAFVTFNSNDEIEIVPTPYSVPYNATFNAADGVVNAINIGNIAVDGKVGIWFKRIINVDNYNAVYSDESLENNGNPVEENEDITLVINWV